MTRAISEALPRLISSSSTRSSSPPVHNDPLYDRRIVSALPAGRRFELGAQRPSCVHAPVELGPLEHDELIGDGLRPHHAEPLRAGQRSDAGAQLDGPRRAAFRIVDALSGVDESHPRRIPIEVVDVGVELGRRARHLEPFGDLHHGAPITGGVTSSDPVGPPEGAGEQGALHMEQPVEIVVVVELRHPRRRGVVGTIGTSARRRRRNRWAPRCPVRRQPARVARRAGCAAFAETVRDRRFGRAIAPLASTDERNSLGCDSRRSSSVQPRGTTIASACRRHSTPVSCRSAGWNVSTQNSRSSGTMP